MKTQHWLGIHDLKDEGEFVTTNREKVSEGSHYVNWGTDEPDNLLGQDEIDQDAVRMNINGYWSDAFVNQKHAYVCVIDPRLFSDQRE